MAAAKAGHAAKQHKTITSTVAQIDDSIITGAHGSRRLASNEEVRQIAACLRKQARAEFTQVECAFLEIAEPSIPDAITGCIEAGAKEVIILPYFLSAGRHVSKEIPALVDK